MPESPKSFFIWPMSHQNHPTTLWEKDKKRSAHKAHKTFKRIKKRPVNQRVKLTYTQPSLRGIHSWCSFNLASCQLTKWPNLSHIFWNRIVDYCNSNDSNRGLTNFTNPLFIRHSLTESEPKAGLNLNYVHLLLSINVILPTNAWK